MGLEDHDLDEEGQHYADECQHCIEKSETTLSSCRCGKCCAGGLLIEATLRDAEREPRIKECQTIKGFTDELQGYVLNDKANDYACRFFDQNTRLCTVWETRPLCCRLFDCSAYEHRRSD
jgi:Fe-S-cluster containining protein